MKSKIKKILRNNTYCVIIGVIVGLLVVLFMTLCNKDEEVDVTYLLAKLEKSSELTTAKLTFEGIYPYKDSGIKIISRSDFLMIYQATARAGIDVKKVKITADYVTKTIMISLPKAEVLDIKVDPNSIKYYDEGFALFNFNSKEDANKAQAEAEKKAKEICFSFVLFVISQNDRTPSIHTNR